MNFIFHSKQKQEEYPGTKLKGRERYHKLYHYTSFETFVKIWLSKKLKFGIIEDVNDLQEVDHNVSCLFHQAPLSFAYYEAVGKYKQISLSMDYNSWDKGCMSTMMWGHYGGKRKGVCIELDFNKIIFPPNTFKGIVKYKNLLNYGVQIPDNAKNIEDIKTFIKKKKNELFFTKHINWKGENEFRIVNNHDEYLDIQDAISAIYLTSNLSDECLLTETLVANCVPVKFLQFQNINGKSIPFTEETKSSREKIVAAKNNPDNALLALTDDAKQRFEKMKQNKQ